MVDAFKKLFGIERGDVGARCVLTPLNEVPLFEGLGIRARARGDYFKAATTGHATIIGTRYSLLVGDCVLWLADTPCRDVVLFGCCGGLGKGVGSRLVVERAHPFESFSAMLASCGPCGNAPEGPGASPVLPDAGLTEELARALRPGAERAACATVGSLKLEEALLPAFRALGVDCLDMESSAVFSAARKAGKRAAALLYVADAVPDKPWHEQLSRADIRRLAAARKSLAGDLCGWSMAEPAPFPPV